MNSIPEAQNEHSQLERLGAQRHLYSSAKTLLGAQLILGGPVALAWSVAVTRQPDLRGWAALWGLTVFLCDVIWFSRLQKSWRERAARIQEAFDCDVLGLPWNTIKAGRPTTPEEVHENAVKYFRRDSSSPPLENWYPPVVGELSLRVARIVCQRINCWWDARQRMRYAQFVGASASVVFLVILWLAFATNMRVQNVVLATVPALPAISIGMRQWVEQREAAMRQSALRQELESLWDQALSGADDSTLTQRSRQVQDEIFQCRKSSVPVFDFIYRLFQPEHEFYMNRSAKDLVEEAKRRLA
jgi:hypothetical protein